ADDHANAARLATGLQEALGEAAQISHATNMVFVQATQELMSGLSQALAGRRIHFSPRGRLVTHLDVSADDVAYVVKEVERWVDARGIQ
ncbi:MAG: low-specificity L-threonine aldolase, partial [Gammaproteobacteria bacterium]